MATIDIRAKTYCSLGQVISGNFADTYAQGSGLIFTRGSVELTGAVRPPVGTKVEFAYQQNGMLARLPRTLRVLSSFADPFRRTTKIELGCLLTFLENRKPPVENPNSREENDVPCNVYSQATLPISALSVAQRILTSLQITADTVPLTNWFSVEEFDLSSGYIQVLSDLLVSEGYIGYLDEQEVLRFRYLGTEVGAGPLITGAQIIDVEPIGVGDLPGDAVVVRYSSLRLKPPEELDDDVRSRRNWDYEEVFGSQKTVTGTYQDDEGETVTVQAQYNPYTFSATTYDAWERAVERLTYERSSVAEVNNRWAIDSYRYQSESIARPAGRMQYTRWTYKIPPSKGNYSTSIDLRAIFWLQGAQGVKSLLNVQYADEDPASECVSSPPEGYEEVTSEETMTFISEAEVAGTLSIDNYAYNGPLGLVDVISFDTAYTYFESRTAIDYEKNDFSGITKTKTEQFLIYGKTTTGQQDLAKSVQEQPSIENFAAFEDWVGDLIATASQPIHQGVELRIRTEREFGLQRRPDQQDRNNQANQKPEVVEQKAEVTWITGSTESTNYIEFTLPYAPDDKISWSPITGYTSTPSDAGIKALQFGRIQNRLLLGNRNGVSLQLPVSLMPPRPFDPLYVQAQGLTGQYRVNGCSYTFDASGIVASADCLFWGGTGQEAP